MRDVIGNPINWDFDLLATLNRVPGVTRFAPIGYNRDIDTGTIPETVWAPGGAYPWQTAAASWEIVSTSAQDSTSGTGLRTVLLQLLDEDYVPFTYTATLNGTTPVVIPTPALRVNGMIGILSGSTGQAVGDINLRISSNSTVVGQIPAGNAFMECCIYTVPANSTAIIKSFFFSINRTGGNVRDAVFAPTYRTSTGTTRSPLEFGMTQTSPFIQSSIGVRMTEKLIWRLGYYR